MRVVITHLNGAMSGHRLLFEVERLTVGRARDSDVRLGLNDTRASTRHAELRVENDRCVLADLGSTNGTFVNEKRVDRVKLRGGEIVTFGYGGPSVRVDLYEEMARVRPSLDEWHEFPFRARYVWFFFASAVLLAIVAVVSFLGELVVVSIPSGLAAAVLFLGGLAAVRINVTVGPDGIEHNGLTGTALIAWRDVAALETLPRKTGMLRGQVCTVRGWRSTIRFSPEDYTDGFLLASLIAQASGREWGPPNAPVG